MQQLYALKLNFKTNMPKFENGYCVINRIDGGSNFLVFMGRLFFKQITSPQNSKKPHNPQKLAWTNLSDSTVLELI